jgi:hypothetical protein
MYAKYHATNAEKHRSTRSRSLNQQPNHTHNADKWQSCLEMVMCLGGVRLGLHHSDHPNLTKAESRSTQNGRNNGNTRKSRCAQSRRDSENCAPPLAINWLVMCP